MDASSQATPEQLDGSRWERRNGLVAGDEGEIVEEGDSCREQRGCQRACPRLCLGPSVPDWLPSGRSSWS